MISISLLRTRWYGTESFSDLHLVFRTLQQLFCFHAYKDGHLGTHSLSHQSKSSHVSSTTTKNCVYHTSEKASSKYQNLANWFSIHFSHYWSCLSPIVHMKLFFSRGEMIRCSVNFNGVSVLYSWSRSETFFQRTCKRFDYAAQSSGTHHVSFRSCMAQCGAGKRFPPSTILSRPSSFCYQIYKISKHISGHKRGMLEIKIGKILPRNWRFKNQTALEIPHPIFPTELRPNRPPS